MIVETTSPVQALDLDVSASGRSPSNRRALKWAGGTVFGLSAFCWAGIGWDVYHYGANGATYIGAVIIGAFGVFNVWLGALVLRGFREENPSRLQADVQGVALSLENGRRLRFAWNDSRTRLRVYVLNKDPKDGGPVAYLALPARKWIALTPASATRLLELARAAGVESPAHKTWIKYRGPATLYTLRGIGYDAQ
jgi:hypothetical protein